MPLALDLCCCAGGASMGLHQAGFTVVGVDNRLQPRYPFKFILASALVYPLTGFDFIWASPPCQRHCKMVREQWKNQTEHPDLISRLRRRLVKSGIPYIIENVPGAPLHNPIMLCGSMFGLRLRRHRLFEASFPLPVPGSCNHKEKVVRVYGHSGGSSVRDGWTLGGVDTWRVAMGIDWMTGTELAEAIPPAYSKYIGEAFLRAKNLG